MELSKIALSEYISERMESLDFCIEMTKLKGNRLSKVDVDAYISSYNLLVSTNALLELYIKNYSPLLPKQPSK